MNPLPPVKPGTYVHYKGGRYFFLVLAETHQHNEDRDVVYVSLTHGKAVTRPHRQDSRAQDSWSDDVTWPDGMMRSRFVHESHLSAFELSELQRLWHQQEKQKE